MVRHIVAWNFKEDFSSDENIKNAEKVKCDLESLKSIINEIIDINVNIDFASKSDRNIMLNCLFNSEEDLEKYQNHPEHKKVGEFVRRVLKDRICLDFYE